MKPHRQFDVLQAHALLHIQNGTRLLERTFKPIEFLAYTSALLAVEEEIHMRIVKLRAEGTPVPLKFEYVLKQVESVDTVGHWTKSNLILEKFRIAGKVNPRKVSFGVRTVITADTMEQLCIRMAKLEFEIADYLVAWDKLQNRDDLVIKQQGYREVALKALSDYGVEFSPELS